MVEEHAVGTHVEVEAQCTSQVLTLEAPST